MMARTQFPTRLPTITAQRILIWGRDYGGVCDQVVSMSARQRGLMEPADPDPRICNDPLGRLAG